MIPRQVDLKRQIINARSHNKPLVVIEGIDDLQFYQRILDEVLEMNSVKLMRAERVVGTGGCRKLVSEIESIQDFINSGDKFDRYFLGIIDRDCFYYVSSEEEIIKRDKLKCLHVLKYYSFESYFVNKENIRKVFIDSTRVTQEYITDDVMKIIVERLEEQLFKDLYYIGLECLYNKRNGEKGLYNYDNEPKDIKAYGKRKHFISKIKNNGRMNELDEFALRLNLHYSFENIKLIVKGKHLLRAFANQIAHEVLNSLFKNCNSEIACCIDEDECDKQSCIWHNKINSQKHEDLENFIYATLLNYKVNSEIEDITKAFKRLNIMCS